MLRYAQRLRRMRFTLFLTVFILLSGILFILYRLSLSPLFNQYEIVRSYRSKSKNNNLIVGGLTYKLNSSTQTILLWNSFFGDARWKLPKDTLGIDYFRDELHCPVYNCELTNQRDFLPSIELYNAIVFHVAEPFSLLQPVPSLRHAYQAYVYATMEPPGETKHQLSDEGYFYNLTMTYRLDSDIVWPYMHMIDRETGGVIAPSRDPHWRTPPTKWNDSAVWEVWQGKVKMSAWFVSHCSTLSKREHLAAKMQEFLEVDVYGSCSQFDLRISSCERGSMECDHWLDTKYKFYLAFENSLCTDYVTEKVYMALDRHIIPVVYGGANYTRFLPPHSYIDVESYGSVEELVQYLQYVADDVDEYMSYFWWRHYYKLGSISPFCALCEQLHSPTWQQKTQSYTNIEEWWLGDSCRFEPKIAFT